MEILERVTPHFVDQIGHVLVLDPQPPDHADRIAVQP
jgi:hypothetical protein